MKQPKEKQTCATCKFNMDKYCVRIRFPILNDDVDNGCRKYLKKGAPENPWLM